MLRVEINTDNDAFSGGDGPLEVSNLLCFIGRQILIGRRAGSVRDSNGNTCGQWDLRFEHSQAEGDDE